MAQIFETALTLPSTYLKAIGHITHQWATLEDNIGRLIQVLTRLGRKDGRLLTSQLTARSKIEVFKALIERKMDGHKERSMAEHLATAAEQLADKRNKFMHGTWGHPPGKKNQLHLIFVGGSSSNRIMPRSYPLKSKQLMELGDMMRRHNKIALRLLSILESEQAP